MDLLHRHSEFANALIIHILLTTRPCGTHSKEATSDEDVVGVRLQRRDKCVVGLGAFEGARMLGAPTTGK